jgi:hypothetical protein
VSFAAIALAGCSGGKSEKAAPQPVAAATPVAEPTPAPATHAAVETAPVAVANTIPAPQPETAAGSSGGDAASTPTPEKTPKPPPQPDALQWMRDGEARRVDYERRLAEAKSNLEAADLSMATWERNVLAFKNPFLARPQLSPEDSQAIAGMNGTERVRWAEGRLSEVAAKRDAAQKALDNLKANPPTN